MNTLSLFLLVLASYAAIGGFLTTKYFAPLIGDLAGQIASQVPDDVFRRWRLYMFASCVLAWPVGAFAHFFGSPSAEPAEPMIGGDSFDAKLRPVVPCSHVGPEAGPFPLCEYPERAHVCAWCGEFTSMGPVGFVQDGAKRWFPATCRECVEDEMTSYAHGEWPAGGGRVPGEGERANH